MSSDEALNMKFPVIQSTAGVGPVRNEKGEFSMEKVGRYVSGKRPVFTAKVSSDKEEEDLQFVKKKKQMEKEADLHEDQMSDPHLKRFLSLISEDVGPRHKQITEAEVVPESSKGSEGTGHPKHEQNCEDEKEKEQVDDKETVRRRAMMCQQAMERTNEEEEEEVKVKSEYELEDATDNKDKAELQPNTEEEKLRQQISDLTGDEKSVTEILSLSEEKMGRGSPLGERLREQIVQQFKNNIPQRKIAKNLGISSSTVHNIIKRFRESGDTSVRKGQGRKPILDGRDIRALRQHCIENKLDSVVEVTAWAQEHFGKTMSVNTIRRCIPKY